MTLEEAKNIIEIAIAEVEWCYPMEYAIAFETVLEALKQYEIDSTPIIHANLEDRGDRGRR